MVSTFSGISDKGCYFRVKFEGLEAQDKDFFLRLGPLNTILDPRLESLQWSNWSSHWSSTVWQTLWGILFCGVKALSCVSADLGSKGWNTQLMLFVQGQGCGLHWWCCFFILCLVWANGSNLKSEFSLPRNHSIHSSNYNYSSQWSESVGPTSPFRFCVPTRT